MKDRHKCFKTLDCFPRNILEGVILEPRSVEKLMSFDLNFAHRIEMKLLSYSASEIIVFQSH